MQKVRVALVGVSMAVVTLSAQDTYYAARYRSGSIPPLASLTVGGGQVFLELSVSRDGNVTDIKTLRTTPPFTGMVAELAKDWLFFPAQEEVQEPGESRPRLQHVPSKVLLAAVVRSPTLIGPSLGDPAKDVASESDETPFPVTLILPPYPQSTREAALVLVEAGIDRSGAVVDSTVIRSAAGFDDVARSTARQWTFRSARLKGRSIPTRAYILFGFPAPITIPPNVNGVPPIVR